MEKKLFIVGCGPGSPDYLTPVALKAIQSASVILGVRKLLDLFPDVNAQRIVLGRNISEAVNKISMYIETQVVAVLVSGDPGLFSLARLVVDKYGRDSCEIIPGISSAQTAFARLGLSWHDARLISAHKKVPEDDPVALYREFRKLAIFAGNAQTGKWLASSFVNFTDKPDVVVCENLTLQDEKITHLRIGDLESFEIEPSSIIIVLDREMLK